MNYVSNLSPQAIFLFLYSLISIFADMKIAIIGAGAMGGAVAKGLIDRGFNAADISLSNPTPGKLEEFSARGVKCSNSNTAIIEGADIVIVAVKPWILPGVAAEISSSINDNQQVGVIVAGVSGLDLLKMFQAPHSRPPRLAIVMPNTAMVIGESMTFVTPVNSNTDDITELFKPLGEVLVIEERLMPAATALASCGIAFAMRYIRAAVEGGVELGFRASAAQVIVAQTVKGAAMMLADTSRHPEAEIDKVTTPGGITIRGLNAMEQAGFTNSVIQGLKASCK